MLNSPDPIVTKSMPSQPSIYPQVIVAGMSRTGTESLKRALEILYGDTMPAYHMSEVLNQPKHLKFWSDLVFDRQLPENANWHEIFAGYIATTDLPSAYYFDYIATAFPQAKVILTLREENAWFDSYFRLLRAVHRFRFLRFLPPLDRYWPFGVRLSKLVFGDAFDEAGSVKQKVIAAYQQHNQRVRQTIEPERLLEFEVQQGWKPLCEFLGFNVPDLPFPHLNAGQTGPSQILSQAVQRLSLRRAWFGFKVVLAVAIVLLAIQLLL